MADRIRNIVIVGGGTAGWITAGVLGARYKGVSGEHAVNVTLVESPNVPIIGVGEGTWPTLRSTLRSMGIRETDFIRECDATFKQGAKFCKWTTGEEDDAYYHPLVLPESFLETNLVDQWLASDRDQPFAETVCSQADVCELGLAPKTITSPEYDGILNYAYHLNAGKFSVFLQKHCTQNLGVQHILADVIDVQKKENGDVASVQTEQAGTIEGDFFIDCTGFKSLLLGEAQDVRFNSCSDTLFVDTALAARVAYPPEQTRISSHTISTAQDAGWIWDIGLSTRRGIGHVYSSRHQDEDAARKQLNDYLMGVGANPQEVEIRKIPINSGHRELFWKNNVVAVGLSAGFLEPLEASAIVLIELSAKLLAEQLPATKAAMPHVAKRFNEIFLYRWERIIDFLKLHYCITKRNDTQFWRDNQGPDTIPQSLQDLLELWRYQSPWQGDFIHRDEVFPSASYQYVLYGMGFETQPSFYGKTDEEVLMGMKSFQQNRSKTAALVSTLPKNRELINKIHKYGLQTI